MYPFLTNAVPPPTTGTCSIAYTSLTALQVSVFWNIELTNSFLWNNKIYLNLQLAVP